MNGDGKPDIYLHSVGGFVTAGAAETLRRSILLNAGSGFSNPGNLTLSAATLAVFMVPLRTRGRTFTLVGYELSASSAAFTSLTPVVVANTF